VLRRYKMVGGISDYLVWAAEKLEKKYKWDFEDAMYWLTHASYIPHDVSVQKYLEETRK
jgi:hypothetical protein